MPSLPTYPAAITLQWCGESLGVRPDWYPIRPPLPSDGRPWPSVTAWPSRDLYRPELELLPL